MRQIVLDTETTGLETSDDHRIIEIGCVELVDRRPTGNDWHHYINPERDIDDGAAEVHGITLDDLRDKPRFAEIARDFIDYIRGAELVIHNAPFDVGFLDHEFAKLDDGPRVADICKVADTLVMARQKHPGQKNSLDALCRRYDIDNTHRELHGALLDARLLAEVYLAMTGGQTRLFSGGGESGGGAVRDEVIRRLAADRAPLRVIRADDEERARHRARLAAIAESAGEASVWETLEATERDA